MYPNDMIRNHAFLVQKCKALRRQISKGRGRTGTDCGPFTAIVGRVKLSGLYCKMHRKILDAGIGVPPSYRTRIADGYSVPSREEYMEGYRTIFKLDLPIKTVQNSFNLMNRQIWTNKKQYLRMGEAGQAGEVECRLCGRVETTQRLMAECEEYSERMWEVFERVINGAGMNAEGSRARVHIHNIMYNTRIQGIQDMYSTEATSLIQEVKRYIVYKRYQRCENDRLNAIVYDEQRIAMHLSNIIQKLISPVSYTHLTLPTNREV